MRIFRYITLVGLLAISLLFDSQLIAYSSNLQLPFATISSESLELVRSQDISPELSHRGSGRSEFAQAPEILSPELSYRGSGRSEFAQAPEILSPELSYRGSGRLEFAQAPEISSPELSYRGSGRSEFAQAQLMVSAEV
ncbi:MAG: hypothetical protein F6K31_27540 [Symploca sp. SIO2G7]|nr:hypothetical protein [Symploca sp. SIO2G7]